MKRIFMLLTLLTFSVATFATSTPTNDKEKSPVKEGVRGEIAAPANDIQALGPQESPVNIDGVDAVVNNQNTSESTTRTPLRGINKFDGDTQRIMRHRMTKVKHQRTKITRDKYKRMKRERTKKPRRTHGGSGILGLLALIFGLIAILFGWFFWPIGLLFGLSAIILGAIGLGGERRGMALAGMILGILTILIPVLLIAVLIAAIA